MDQCEREEHQSPALIAVSTVLESFGRALVCLDKDFRVVHVSDLLRHDTLSFGA